MLEAIPTRLQEHTLSECRTTVGELGRRVTDLLKPRGADLVEAAQHGEG